MALEVKSVQESASTKKSIILRAKHQGDMKVVLVKHYLTSLAGKVKETGATFTKDVTSKAYKRKSFEMGGTKEINEQCSFGKRRRSVPLTGTTKPTVQLVQDLAQNVSIGLGIVGNNYCTQNARPRKNTMQVSLSKRYCQSAVEVLPSTTHINETLDFVRSDQQHDELVDDFQDCVLMPANWSDKRNMEGLVDSSKVKLDVEHKSLLSVICLDLPQVQNSSKCKSLFETYRLKKVHNSIVDEM